MSFLFAYAAERLRERKRMNNDERGAELGWRWREETDIQR